MVSRGKKEKDIPRAQTTVHCHLGPCNSRPHIHGGCIHVVGYVLRFFYSLFPTHFPRILFACSYLMLIISCLHSYFLLQTFFYFMHSLTVYAQPHAQSCTVCLLMCSLITHYIRTGQTVVFGSQSLIDNSSSTLDFLKPLKTILVG